MTWDMRNLIDILREDPEEQAEDMAQEQQIAAVAQLIADKTEDKNAQSKLTTDAFIGMLNKMGIPMTKEGLMDLVQNGKLESVIKDVNDDEVVFKGTSEIGDSDMTVDKAKDIVSKMAKRSAKKGVKEKPKAKADLDTNESVEEESDEPKQDSIYGKGIYEGLFESESIFNEESDADYDANLEVSIGGDVDVVLTAGGHEVAVIDIEDWGRLIYKIRKQMKERPSPTRVPRHR